MRGTRLYSARQAFTLLELVICFLIILVLLALLLPSVTRSREPARRTECKGRLKQIGLALYNYHDVYGTFPPAYTVDADGKPLHSWRTLILPYLHQSELYAKIDLSKPWDDPANEQARNANFSTYVCPSSVAKPAETSYLAVVTSDSVIRQQHSRSTAQIRDGLDQTMMILEVPYDHSVPWMSPQDADESLIGSLGAGSKYSHSGGCHFLLADGAVRFLSRETAPATRQALTTATGGDQASGF